MEIWGCNTLSNSLRCWVCDWPSKNIQMDRWHWTLVNWFTCISWECWSHSTTHKYFTRWALSKWNWFQRYTITSYIYYVPSNEFLKAALVLLEQHQKFPKHEIYVRAVEQHNIPGEKEVLLVVCMFKSMSELLANAKWPTIDTLFKRVYGWQEFEIDAWFPEFDHCK